MAPRPKPCSVCARPDVADINAALLVRPLSSVAAEFHFNYGTVEVHKRLHAKGPPKPKANPALAKLGPEPPLADPAAEPLVRAKMRAEWLNWRLRYLQQSGAPGGEITACVKEIGACDRQRGNLEGAFDLTEAQIIKTQPYQRLKLRLLEVLEAHPEALKAVSDMFKKASGDAS